MELEELTGTYTYRSFRDVPEPVQSFDDLRFAQLALRLAVQPDGTVAGTLIFPAPAGVESMVVVDEEVTTTMDSTVRRCASGIASHSP